MKTCYLIDGTECTYVTELPDGHAIRRRYEYDRGDETETREGPIEAVDDVFTTAPRKVLDAEVTRLQARLSELRAEVNEAARAVRDAHRDIEDAKVRIQQHDAVRRIDDFLAGKFQWVVTSGWGGLKVMPVSEALKPGEYDRRHYDRRHFKLVTLFGTSNGSLEWRINDYSDGSGNERYRMWPCMTEDEAKAKAQEVFDAGVKEWREKVLSGQKDAYAEVCAWADTAPRPDWLTVPADLAAHIRSRKIAHLSVEATRTKEAAAAAQAKLDAVLAEGA